MSSDLLVLVVLTRRPRSNDAEGEEVEESKEFVMHYIVERKRVRNPPTATSFPLFPSSFVVICVLRWGWFVLLFSI